MGGHPQRSRLRGPRQGEGGLPCRGRGLQCPHGRLPEVHGGVEGGGGLGLRSLLAVEPQCKYSSQMFALGSPTSANIHPDFYVSIVPAFAIYMQTISNKYYVLTYHMFYSISPC